MASFDQENITHLQGQSDQAVPATASISNEESTKDQDVHLQSSVTQPNDSAEVIEEVDVEESVVAAGSSWAFPEMRPDVWIADNIWGIPEVATLTQIGGDWVSPVENHRWNEDGAEGWRTVAMANTWGGQSADGRWNSAAGSTWVGRAPDGRWIVAGDTAWLPAQQSGQTIAQDSTWDEEEHNRFLQERGETGIQEDENGWDQDDEDGWDQDEAQSEVLECVCGDVFEENSTYVILNCGHARCDGCLEQNVSTGLENRQSYPPRCCPESRIDMLDILPRLSDALVERWFAIKDEYEDPLPIYCGKKECSKHLTQETYEATDRWALCIDCSTQTCTSCSQAKEVHVDGQDCPDRLEKVDRELMIQSGWKACPECAHMIEKEYGCDHMECICGCTFCYGCGNVGIACNCHGRNEWVDEEGGIDPEEQQRIEDDIRANAQEADWADNQENDWVNAQGIDGIPVQEVDGGNVQGTDGGNTQETNGANAQENWFGPDGAPW